MNKKFSLLRIALNFKTFRFNFHQKGRKLYTICFQTVSINKISWNIFVVGSYNPSFNPFPLFYCASSTYFIPASDKCQKLDWKLKEAIQKCTLHIIVLVAWRRFDVPKFRGKCIIWPNWAHVCWNVGCCWTCYKRTATIELQKSQMIYIVQCLNWKFIVRTSNKMAYGDNE